METSPVSTNSPHTPVARLRRRLPGAVLLFALVTALGSLASTGLAGEDAVAAQRDWREVSATVDRLVLDKLAAEGVEPAARSSDSEFLRRLYLDLLGTVPTPAEVTTFLADRTRDKRARKIDELMASDAYAENQASFWFRTLTGISVHQGRAREGQGGRYIAGEGGKKFHEWLSTQIAAKRPYNAMVEDLITATGRTDENGAAGYLARWESNANNTAGAVAKHFLGVQIQCAQCHDHIYETDWKQTDFEGMAAFFALTSVRRVPEYRDLQKLRREMQKKGKQGGGADLRRPGAQGGAGMDGAMSREMRSKMRDLAKYRNIVEVREANFDPRFSDRMARRLKNAKNEQLKARAKLMGTTPKFWLASPAADLPGVSRRYLLARWITSDDNPYFAQALANRMWGTFLGRGIVDPVDDFNSFQAPSHPRVLQMLAEDFKSNGYDLQRLQRIVLNSATYQRTSRWEGETEPDPALFAKAAVRSLNTEQLYFALVRATGMETRLNQASRRQGQNIQRGIFSAFTFVFDDDEGKAEEDFSGSIPQGLFLMNGDLIQKAIGGEREIAEPSSRRKPNRNRKRFRRKPQTMLDQLVATEKSEARIVEQLFLRAYAREPDSRESREALKFLRSRKSDYPKGYADLFWAILNSAEFMTNH